jgi:hypothetical protein
MSREDADLPDGLRDIVLEAAAHHSNGPVDKPGVSNKVSDQL